MKSDDKLRIQCAPLLGLGWRAMALDHRFDAVGVCVALEALFVRQERTRTPWSLTGGEKGKKAKKRTKKAT